MIMFILQIFCTFKVQPALCISKKQLKCKMLSQTPAQTHFEQTGFLLHLLNDDLFPLTAPLCFLTSFSGYTCAEYMCWINVITGWNLALLVKVSHNAGECHADWWNCTVLFPWPLQQSHHKVHSTSTLLQTLVKIYPITRMYNTIPNSTWMLLNVLLLCRNSKLSLRFNHDKNRVKGKYFLHEAVNTKLILSH